MAHNKLNHRYLEKVSAFVTRDEGAELLLFQHPYSGVQFPAGTVEEGEPPLEAVLRELSEETGLTQAHLISQIGVLIETQPAHAYILTSSKIYARPDLASFAWATLHKGIKVRILRQQGEFAQVSYEEEDRFPDPQYITYQITGWLPQDCLAGKIRRHLFHLATEQATPPAWEHFADQHLFRPFWAPLNSLPEIVWPQNEWWSYISQELGYDFSRKHISKL